MDKAKSKLLKWGFKAEAERKSIALREELGLAKHEKLCAFKLAKHLGIKVYSIKELVPGDRNRYDEWSALITPNEDNEPIILYNPIHSEARTQSDIMHEISHYIQKHPYPQHKTFDGIPFTLVAINKNHEEEAKWLGAILQLPKDGIFWCLGRKMNHFQISNHFTASNAMVKMRINSLGLNRRNTTA